MFLLSGFVAKKNGWKLCQRLLQSSHQIYCWKPSNGALYCDRPKDEHGTISTPTNCGGRYVNLCKRPECASGDYESKSFFPPLSILISRKLHFVHSRPLQTLSGCTFLHIFSVIFFFSKWYIYQRSVCCQSRYFSWEDWLLSFPAEVCRDFVCLVLVTKATVSAASFYHTIVCCFS